MADPSRAHVKIPALNTPGFSLLHELLHSPSLLPGDGRGPALLQRFTTKSIAGEQPLLKVNAGVTSISCLGDCLSCSDPTEEEGGHLGTEPSCGGWGRSSCQASGPL